MERTEIIKALEKEYDQRHKLEEDLEIELNIAKNLKNAIALIKEQQKELTFCYDKLTELEKECLGLGLHNITLNRKIKYLEDRLKEEMEIKEDMKGK